MNIVKLQDIKSTHRNHLHSCCQVTSVVSDSVGPHGLQLTRLLHPWDSPGKNTGVGCHFLLQLAFLYTNNEKIEREIKETILFTIAMKRIKSLGIYLPKYRKL